MVDKKPQKQNYRNFTSRLAGHLSNLKRPAWFVRLLILIYRKKYKINVADFYKPAKGYKSFNAFFTRKIRENLRPIGEGLVSPVDGSVFDYGLIDPDNKIYVKFKYYYIDDLICNEFENLSSYAVLYLSPADYHRVHASFDMEIDSVNYLPGTLFSVKKKTVYKKDRVYCRNERIVVSGASPYGKFYLILVGALMVGKVKLTFDSALRTNIRRGIYAEKKFKTPVTIKKGEELGYFEMGSSVIILLENDCLSRLAKPVSAQLKMGEKIS